MSVIRSQKDASLLHSLMILGHLLGGNLWLDMEFPTVLGCNLQLLTAAEQLPRELCAICRIVAVKKSGLPQGDYEFCDIHPSSLLLDTAAYAEAVKLAVCSMLLLNGARGAILRSHIRANAPRSKAVLTPPYLHARQVSCHAAKNCGACFAYLTSSRYRDIVGSSLLAKS